MSETPLRKEGSKLRLQAGGTLNPRRHLYIERPEDQTLLQLLAEGQYVNIMTSRQMGKSSLMVRTAEVLMQRGVRCVIVDLAAELGTPDDASTFFLGLLSKIARDLKIKFDLPAWWAEHPEETVNQRLMRFFREVVLEQVDGPVVCFLDEIDSTLNPKLGWTDYLFTALRGMHNERPMVPAYERLAFCLIGVVWPNELIKDRRTTPYNVGNTLELRDFDPARDDLTPLIGSLGGDPEKGRRLVERVLHWTGGHPYLTIRLCISLVEIGATSPEDVDRRVDDFFRSRERVSGDVHFQQVLRFLETRLANGFATFNLYEKILNGARERDHTTLPHTELKLSGLVKRDDEGCLVIRNRIYERLFDRRWVESSTPKRTYRTYRRYAIAAGIALLVGAVVASGWIRSLQRQLSDAESEFIEKLQSEPCGTCHTDTRHHFEVARFQLAGFDATACTSCHLKHQRLSAIVPSSQSLCEDCHNDLSAKAETALLDVGDFGSAHPQFRPAVITDPAGGRVERIALGAADFPEERSNIKFSHAMHLAQRCEVDRVTDVEQLKKVPIETLQGCRVLQQAREDLNQEGLACADCHRPEPGGVSMLLPLMSNDCAVCHSHRLNFDENAPDRVLPHGRSDDVIAMINDFYAARALRGRLEAVTEDQPGVRLRPGERAPAAAPARPSRGREQIAQEIAARKLEDVFGRTLCGVCHEIIPPAASERGTWEVLPVMMSHVWMPKASFDHGAHRTTPCIVCHKALDSTTSKDVLMPPIETCRTCHQGEQASGLAVPSTCIMCHDYHLEYLDLMLPPAAVGRQGKLTP